jgi:hypothetical protein
MMEPVLLEMSLKCCDAAAAALSERTSECCFAQQHFHSTPPVARRFYHVLGVVSIRTHLCRCGEIESANFTILYTWVLERERLKLVGATHSYNYTPTLSANACYHRDL